MAGELAALDIAFTSSGADQTAASINKVATAATAATSALSGIENVNPLRSFSSAQIDKMAASMDRVSNISQRAASGLDRTSAAADRAGASIGRLAANQNRLGGQTGNIAAQFQDIAVQLQAGQSPFIIALQQGTQLSAVLNTVGGGARGVGSALAAAFGSILSPVSLLTIGLIAAGGAAYEYFTAVDDGSDKANAEFKKHNDLIRSVAEQWGDAIPALKAYSDELDRAQKISELQSVVEAKRAIDIGNVTAALDDFISKNQEASDAITAAVDGTGRADTSLAKYALSYEKLLPKIKDGTATVADFNAANLLLGDAVKDSGGDLDKYGKDFLTFSGRAINSLKVIEQFNQEVRDASKNAHDAIEANTTGRINNHDLPDLNFHLPQQAFLPESRPPIELEGLPGEKAVKATGDAQKAVSEYAKELKNLQTTQQQSAQSLQLESDMLGHSVEEYNRATAALKAKQDLQRTGIDLSSQQAQAYVKEAEALADARTNIDRQKAAYQSLQQEQGTLIDSLVQGATTFGSSWKDTLKNVSQQFTDWVAQMGIANPLKNMLTGTNLPTLGDLFSGKTQVPGAQSTASMTVTAAVVNVNGGVPGLPGFPTSGVPGANTTLSQFLGVGANSNQGNTANTSANMTAYQNAIKSIESNGGDYGIMGPVTKSGDRAYGAYQVMGNNIPSWSQKYTGTQMTPQQFLADPSAQDKVFNGEFGSYVDKYGPSGAASKWFTGSATPTGKQDMLGTSDNQYVQKFNDSLAKATPTIDTLGTTSTKTATDLSSGLGTLGNSLQSAGSQTPSSGGLFSWLGSLFHFGPSPSVGGGSFANGGYTGNGHSRQPAGVVHKGEYVFDAAATRRIGADNLARIRAGSGREYIPANTNSRGSMSKSDVNVKVSVDKNGNLQGYVESIANEKAGAVGQQTRAYMDAYDRDRLPLRMQEINDRPYDRG